MWKFSNLNFSFLAMYAFTSEEQFYDYSNPGFTEASGHFTQVVWKNSSKVGCSVVNCPLAYFETVSKTSSFFVCLYSDAGNWRGGKLQSSHKIENYSNYSSLRLEFAANVQAP